MTEIPHRRPPDPHDYDAPGERENFKRGIDLLLHHTPLCWTCGEPFLLTAGPGPEWVIDHVHKPGCPEGAEREAVEVNVTGGYDAGVHREAEAIWERSDESEDE